jgi:hypothetical protein
MATKKKGNPGTWNNALQLGVDWGAGIISGSEKPLFCIYANFSGIVVSGPRK